MSKRGVGLLCCCCCCGGFFVCFLFVSKAGVKDAETGERVVLRRASSEGAQLLTGVDVAFVVFFR